MDLGIFKKLRNLGYSLPEALAELVDNSIKAKAKNIWIYMFWADDAGKNSYVMVCDDGKGMNENELLNKALTFPKADKADEGELDLSKFGLGLKTGSFQHCESITVITKTNSNVLKKRLKCGASSVTDEMPKCINHKFINKQIEIFQKQESGCIIIWTELDRMTNLRSQSRVLNFYEDQEKAKKHFKLIYHKFLLDNQINIFFNGGDDHHKILSWDPFYKKSDDGIKLEDVELNFFGNGKTKIKPWIIPENLPYKETSNEPKSNLQGLYFFRKKRLISYGGWFGLGRGEWGIQERYNRLRIEAEIPLESDEEWLTISKNKVLIPEFATRQLEKSIGLIRKKYIEKLRNQNAK